MTHCWGHVSKDRKTRGGLALASPIEDYPHEPCNAIEGAGRIFQKGARLPCWERHATDLDRDVAHVCALHALLRLCERC